ncbi:MAG TPA: SDR family oxidoreductase [Lentimicrobium sp.]|nr:SDR family oxidoreductase [Lentimicrobium sp.]
MNRRNDSDSMPVMIITGTSRGIGFELAKHYLDAGYTVAGCSRSRKAMDHPSYYHEELDITDEKALIRFVKDVYKLYRRIDVLINNAGVASMNHLMLTPLSAVERIYKSNVFAPFVLIREVAKVMSKAKQGRIVNISSVASALDLEGEAAYASSKAALESLTRIAAKELAPFNITVNALGPTPFDTALIRTVGSDKIDNLVQRQTIKRKAQFSDIANVIDFFIRPGSSFVTGQVIYLGGIN